MLFNKINMEAIPRPVFAHIYSCPGYESRFKKMLPNIEIAYVKKGELKIEIMGREYVAREGSFLILPHSYEFYIHASENKAHIHYTISAMIDEKSTLEEDGEMRNEREIVVPLIAENILNHEKCESLIYEAINEYQKPDNGGNIKCGAIVAQLICELSQSSDTLKEKSGEKAGILDRRIKKYIEKNLGSKILLQDIGEALGKNANYLNQVFKKKNGLSIISYVNLEKMKKAAVLIGDEGCSTKEAANAVGISDINYFSRLFKQKMGMSVSGYKSSSADFTFSLADKEKIKSN